jgi:hypothetical protein
MKEGSVINRDTKTMNISVKGERAESLPIAGLFLMLCALFAGPAMAAKMEMHKQVDTYGIKLGMTISEARALMESQGGKLKRTDFPAKQWHTLPAGSKDWMYHFSYTASLEPKKQSATQPQTKAKNVRSMPPGFNRYSIMPNDAPDVTLLAYPTVKGRTTDPDTLVIYAIRSNLLFDPQNITKVETFASNIQGKYGPARELLASGHTVDFSVLPDVTSGTSYSIADLTSDTAHRKVHRTDEICANLRDTVLGFAGRPFMGPSVLNFNKIYNAPPRPGRGTPTELTNCGEVTRIHLRTNMPASSDIKSGAFARYNYVHLEKAMRAFAECKKRGIAACVTPN